MIARLIPMLALVGGLVLAGYGFTASDAFGDGSGRNGYAEFVAAHRWVVSVVIATVVLAVAVIAAELRTRAARREGQAESAADVAWSAVPSAVTLAAAGVLVYAALLPDLPQGHPVLTLGPGVVAGACLFGLAVGMIGTSLGGPRRIETTVPSGKARLVVAGVLVVVMGLTAAAVALGRLTEGRVAGPSLTADTGWSPRGEGVPAVGAVEHTTDLDGATVPQAIPGGAVVVDEAELVAVDTRTGERRWGHSREVTGYPLHPDQVLVSRDAATVIVRWAGRADDAPASVLEAYDAETGETRWSRRGLGRLMGDGPTGVIVTYGEVDGPATEVRGHDPATGETVWTRGGAAQERLHAVPVVGPDLVGVMLARGERARDGMELAALDPATGRPVRSEVLTSDGGFGVDSDAHARAGGVVIFRLIDATGATRYRT